MKKALVAALAAGWILVPAVLVAPEPQHARFASSTAAVAGDVTLVPRAQRALEWVAKGPLTVRCALSDAETYGNGGLSSGPFERVITIRANYCSWLNDLAGGQRFGRAYDLNIGEALLVATHEAAHSMAGRADCNGITSQSPDPRHSCWADEHDTECIALANTYAVASLLGVPDARAFELWQGAAQFHKLITPSQPKYACPEYFDDDVENDPPENRILD